MSSSQRSDENPAGGESSRGSGLLSRHEGHPFREPSGEADAERCALCGERRVHILHHPTRIRAACLLRGLDPDAVMGGKRG